MSSRHQGRHRTAHGGPGQVPEPVEGRHRTAAGPPTATRPLLAASGTVAAALTAIVLSGTQGPLGALFPERVEEPRPTTASASPRNGAPTATDVAQAASYSPAPGSRWGLSIWEVLLQQDLGGPGLPPGSLDDGSADPVWGPRGAGPGAGDLPSVPSAGAPSTPAGTAGSVLATAPSTPSTAGDLGRTGSSQQPRVAGPGDGTGPQSPSGGPAPGSDETPADPLPVPGTPPVQALPPAPTNVAEPVVKAAEPVIKAAEPVTEAAEPVTEAVEPKPSPVVRVPEQVAPPEPVEPKVPEPVEDALESVVQAVPEAAEVEELPADVGELDRPTG